MELTFEKIFETYIYHNLVDDPDKLNKSIDKELPNLKFTLKQ